MADNFLVFATNNPLREAAIDAGFAAELDLESLSTDDTGAALPMPPRIRTQIEATMRAGISLVVLGAHQNDPSVSRVCEILKEARIQNYRVEIVSLRNEPDPVGLVRTAIQGTPRPSENALQQSPDSTPVSSGLNYKPFPVAALPTPIRVFVEAASLAMNADPVFFILPMLAVCGSCIGTTRRLSVKKKWLEYPVLWTVTIAESGSMKTPTMNLVMEPLYRIHGERHKEFASIREEWEQTHELYEKARKKSEKDPTTKPGSPPKEPVMERLFVSDVTIEALAPILQQSPRGVLLCRDELSAWLSGFERYSSSSDLPSWLSLYNAQALTVDRRSSGHLYVPRAAVSITGSIQPAVFQRALTKEHIEAGLGARLVCAMPPRVVKEWTENELPPEAERAWTHLVEDLLELKHQEVAGEPEPQTLILSPEAKRIWVAFFNELALEQNQSQGERAAVLAKLEALVARLALVFAIVERVSLKVDDLAPVDQIAMESAIEVARWVLAERDRIGSILETRTAAGPALAGPILDALRQAGAKGLSRKDLNGHFHGHKSTDEIETALHWLSIQGQAERRVEATSGRPREIWLCQQT